MDGKWLHLGIVAAFILGTWAGCAVRDLNAPAPPGEEPIPSQNNVDWEKTSPLGEGTIRALIFSANNYLTAGGESGQVYRSKNRGDFWQAIPISGAAILTFALDENGVLYAGSDGEGIFVSRFNGKSWTPGNLSAGHVHALLALPDGRLLAGLSNGLWQRKPSAGQWSLVPLPTLGTRQVFCLLATESFLMAGTDHGVFRSAGDQRWEVSGLNEMAVLSLARSRNGWVFAGTATNGIWRTASGTTWLPASDGLEARVVFALAVNSRNVVFAATENGVFFSGDQGETWAAFNSGLPSGRVLALTLDTDDKLYAAVESAGVFRTVEDTRFR